MIIGSVVGWVVGLALQAIGETQAVSPIATVCNLATQALVVTPLSNGWQYVCLRVVRGQGAAVGDLFEPYRGRLFVTAMSSLVQALLVALSSLPVGIAFVVVVMTGVVPLGRDRFPDNDWSPEAVRIADRTGSGVDPAVHRERAPQSHELPGD